MLPLRAMALVCFAAAGCQSAEHAPPRPDAALAARPGLSVTARDVLRKKMERHGSDMDALTHTVLFLDDRGTAEVASRIAADARLARPLSDDATELNTQLPPRFFTLQDEERQFAAQLAAAAQRRDRAAMADAFGNLSRVCVQCHGVYFEEPVP